MYIFSINNEKNEKTFKLMPTFYYGTEDTGKGGGLDSKGGFLAKLHPNERVVDASS